MEMDENAAAHAHLKQLLLQQIEGQERVSARYAKILKRLTYLLLTLSFAILGGIYFIIYSINKPDTQINALRKEVKGLEVRTALQRQYIEIDKNDLDLIQKDVNTLIDSIKKQ